MIPGLGLRRWTRREVLVAALCAALAMLAAAVWFTVVRVPASPSAGRIAEAEARNHLDRMIEAGLARDFARLCSMNGAVLNCRYTLDHGAEATVPSTRPESITARYLPRRDSAESEGWLLTVRGKDGGGVPYTTEVMVFRDDEGRLKTINGVWWSSARFSTDDPNTQTEGPE